MKKVIKILAPTLTFIVFAVTINWGYVGLLSKQLIQAATEVARGEGTTSQMLLEELRDFQARDVFNMEVIQKLPFIDSGDGTVTVPVVELPGDGEDYVLPTMEPADGGSNEGRDLYRGMTKEPVTGKPKLGESAKTLGARPDIDIIIKSGMVKSGEGGMSVTPMINDLQPYRRPPKFGGTDKNISVWMINEDDLSDKLIYVPDEPGKDGLVHHGTIQPAYEMTYDEYKKALEETADSWKLQKKDDK
ncbi:MAG: hypothetical protein K6F51_09475 [Acetatifactor sp.]|nr:hypothetical protein [Acetatifactor sp.]